MPKGLKTNRKLSSYRTHFTKCFLFVETWLLDYVYYIITQMFVKTHSMHLFAITAVSCIYHLKTFIWSSPKMSCLNKRIESLFCKWKQFKVVVNIPVDMYHFCINKFTLVESAQFFYIFSFLCIMSFVYSLIFQMAEFAVILLHISLALKFLLFCSYEQKTAWKGTNWHCCWVWPPETGLSELSCLRQPRHYTLSLPKLVSFPPKITSVFLTSHLSLAASCCLVLHLLFPHPQPSRVLDICFL